MGALCGGQEASREGESVLPVERVWCEAAWESGDKGGISGESGLLWGHPQCPEDRTAKEDEMVGWHH